MTFSSRLRPDVPGDVSCVVFVLPCIFYRYALAAALLFVLLFLLILLLLF